jgi:hypothetical protein
MFTVWYCNDDAPNLPLGEFVAEFETEAEAIEFAEQMEDDGYMTTIIDERSGLQ